jgi:hypothetical protein
MDEKIIGSLLYDDHPIPKKSRALKERLKAPVGIALVLIFVSGIVYRFANFREERSVRQFMTAVEGGQYEAAYQLWDVGGRYTMKDFLQDWGKDGYYTKGMRCLNPSNNDSLKSPVAVRVDKESLKISFSPVSKYPSP